jgi:hypothetical protein
MTTYSWPTSLKASMFEAQLVPNVRSFASPYGGAAQSIDLLGERWRFMIELPPCLPVQSGEREAFFTKLRGGAHRVSLWHMARPQPVGTMRGSPTVTSNAAQGADTIAITTTASATVNAGDVLGLTGGHLVMAAGDATANGGGAMTLTLANRLRAAVSAGAAVTWYQPKADFMMVDSGGVPIGHGPGVSGPIQVEFVEVWS